MRFLGEECIRNGYTVVDAIPIAVRLARAGVDYVSLSAGGKFEDARPIPGEPLYPYTGYSGDRCMPGSNYPDGANLYMPEAVRAGLRAHGLDDARHRRRQDRHRWSSPSSVLERGIGDMIGMARALLADPDLPRKWQAGREDAVVRCVYGNVCKALDENFRRVDCTLWPKKVGQAPESDDDVPPEWPAAGPGLTVEYKEGRVLLKLDGGQGQRGHVRLPGVPRRGRRHPAPLLEHARRQHPLRGRRASSGARGTATRCGRTTSRATAGR